MADPARADEVMITRDAAASLGLHLGSVVPVVISPPAGTGPVRRIGLKVVGIGLLTREVVQDQIAKFPTYMVATPALTRSVSGDSSIAYLGVQLRGGTADVAAVERRWNSTERYFTDFQVVSQVQSEADQSIRPMALALGTFGAIAGLAALLLGIQLVARRLSAREHDLAVMRAVGADPATTALDGLVGTLGSVLAGAVLAVGVALALSPLFPIGPVRPVYPDLGVNAIGIAEGLHTSMGVGAAVPTDAGPVTEALGPQGYGPSCNGPNMVFVRVRGGLSPAQGQAAAQRLSDAANRILAVQPLNSVCGGNVATAIGVQRPAQIVNYRSMGTTPVLLAGALALAAVVALGLALAASVRRCRRDLAQLKVLGFVQRQLSAAVAWHASIAVAIGIVVGIPLGIVLGRWLWILFAEQIGAVPAPTVPVLSVLLAAAIALVLANAAAVLPGRRAARTATALVLQEE